VTPGVVWSGYNFTDNFILIHCSMSGNRYTMVPIVSLLLNKWGNAVAEGFPTALRAACNRMALGSSTFTTSQSLLSDASAIQQATGPLL
jgi:hypothetical protein